MVFDAKFRRSAWTLLVTLLVLPVGVDRWKRQRQQSKREKLRDVINAIVRKVGETEGPLKTHFDSTLYREFIILSHVFALRSRKNRAHVSGTNQLEIEFGHFYCSENLL